MYEITNVRKMENGVALYYQKKGEKTFESFNYQELIDMKINALDIIEHPHRYSVDVELHKVYHKDS
jgi:hypothetical protein